MTQFVLHYPSLILLLISLIFKYLSKSENALNMKVFKKSILRIPIFWYIMFLYSLPIYLWLVKGLGNITICICFIGFFTFIFAVLCVVFGYIVTQHDRFIIRNAVNPFWKVIYNYRDVKRIDFCHAYRGGVYLTIHLNNLQVRKHAIECVNKNDLYELADIFKSNKIQVEIIGPIIQEYFSLKKKTD